MTGPATAAPALSATVTARWAAASPGDTAAPPPRAERPPGNSIQRPGLPSSKAAQVQKHLPNNPPRPPTPSAPHLWRSLPGRGGRGSRAPYRRPLSWQRGAVSRATCTPRAHPARLPVAPRGFAASRPPARRGSFTPAAARPGRSRPHLAPSARGHFPPRSKTTVTKGWSPPGGEHRQPASDTGRSSPPPLVLRSAG